MELTIKSRKLNKTFKFFKNYGPHQYIFDSTHKPGCLGRQICVGGYYGGSTLTASDETFEAVCRRWYRQHVKNMINESLNTY
jgi:hypothetical protein